MNELDKEKFEKVINNIKEIILKKNILYDSSVFKHGEIGIFVRLSDKFSRLEYLLKDLKFDLDDEQRQILTDTILDICGYSILWLYLINI